MSKSVAVVGATGAVGRVMREILAERDFPVSAIRLLASARSAGSRLETPWGEAVVEDLATVDPAGIDIALFSAGGDRSREYAPRFAAADAVVIDNSSAFRMDDGVPLIVAGVNDEAIADHKGIIANPNCTTMTLLMGVAPLHRAANLRSMVVSSYQAVSGSGQQGITELTHQNELLGKDLEALVDGGWSDPGADLYVRPIGWNVVPFAGVEISDGYTDEELKLVNETRKILRAPEVAVEGNVRPGAGDDRPFLLGEPVVRAPDRRRRGSEGPGGGAPGSNCGKTPCPPHLTRSALMTSSSAGFGQPWGRRVESTCGRSATTYARVQRSTLFSWRSCCCSSQ